VENPIEMRSPNEIRRPSLATIVGSSLAVIAAGSLLAFSSLAEQAGLEGLTARGLQPAQPERTTGRAEAITVPAPATAPPGDPRDDLTQLVRSTVAQELDPIRVRTAPAPAPAPLVEAPVRREPKPRPDRVEPRARVAVAEPEVPKPDGPPYGHAYGYHKKDGAKPQPAQKHSRGKRGAKDSSDDQPVYARKANDGTKPPKPPKTNKVAKVKGNGHSNGKAKGHSKHADGPGNNGKGKAKGHSKHGK
jgi:hypothetical protein